MNRPQEITRLQLTYLVAILEKKKQTTQLPSASKGILSFEGEMPVDEFDRQMKILGGNK